MSRRAKTPIFSIGQLEAIPRPGRMSSVDLIANQYTAVLESRPNSLYTDAYSEPPSPPPPPPPGGYFHEANNAQLALRRWHSSVNIPEDMLNTTTTTTPRHMLDSPGISPTSDDGTLVSFDEDTVYFKPFSFPEEEPPTTTIPPLPPSSGRHPSRSSSPLSPSPLTPPPQPPFNRRHASATTTTTTTTTTTSA
jgi:hypothetical protein